MNIPKILIVDDMPDVRLLIKLTLQRVGKYDFFEAVNGLEGFELAKEILPDIILMDGIMPVMSGFEAIEKLREDEKTKNIPILMVSSLDTKDEKVKALNSGVSDFISKPFDKIELTIRVNSLIHLYMQFNQKKSELEEINFNLEAKVQEMLENRIEDIKLASIGQMAAGMTHELNTPVSFMKSNLELLKLDVDELENNYKIKQSMLDTIDILNNGISRLRNIIDTTREISKKGGKIKEQQNLYNSLIFALRMVFNRSKHLMPIYINNIEFTLDLNQDFEKYMVDIVKEHIEQVWIIILNNACDEFEKSTLEFADRKLEISIVIENGYVITKFKDNAGNGIKEDILGKVFDAFQSTKVGSGMGIGLNIAKDIIIQHNGEISAYNEDHCAVFEVKLLSLNEMIERENCNE